MVDAHNAVIMVFSSLLMIYKVRKWFLDPENLCFDTSLTSLCGILTILDDFPSFGIMADGQYAPIKGFSLSYMISVVKKWFLDPENLCFDISLTSLCGILTVLDDFPSFGIMADRHYAPIKGFSSSYMISDARKWFLDPENLCFDTSLATLGVKVMILYNIFIFGIMAASDELRNTKIGQIVFEVFCMNVLSSFNTIQVQ